MLVFRMPAAMHCNSAVEVCDEVGDIFCVKTHGRFDLDDVVVPPFGAHYYLIFVHFLLDRHGGSFVRLPCFPVFHKFNAQEQADTSVGIYSY